MQDNEPEEEKPDAWPDLMKIDCSEVYGGWYHSQRRIESLRCASWTHGFVGCRSRSCGQMELTSAVITRIGTGGYDAIIRINRSPMKECGTRAPGRVEGRC